MTESIDSQLGGLAGQPDEMDRELARGPDAVAATLASVARLTANIATELETADRLVLVGTGASLALAITAAPWFRAAGAHRPGWGVVTRESCSAALGDVDGLAARRSDLVIAVSVSGTSPETIAAARLARRRGARILVVTARPDSPLSASADLVVHTPVEPEGGASTASALAALAGLGAMAGALATDLDRSVETRDMLAALVAGPQAVATAGGLVATAERVWLAGFGPAEGLARAGALLLHEKAGVAAVATTPSEFRHGLVEATNFGDAFVSIDLDPPDPVRHAYGRRLSRELVGAGVAEIVISASAASAPPAGGTLIGIPGSGPVPAALAALLRIQQLGRYVAHARGTYRDGFRYLHRTVLAAEELLPPA